MKFTSRVEKYHAFFEKIKEIVFFDLNLIF